MLEFLQRLHGGKPGALFVWVDILFIAGIALFLFSRRKNSLSSDSSFRLRESDRPKATANLRGTLGARQIPGKAARAEDGTQTKTRPMLLTGIRIDGPANEILGVRNGATAAEIKKAYRDLMKQYHPDLVGKPGSREWQDAQRIAEAINRAKDEMLAAAGANRG